MLKSEQTSYQEEIHKMDTAKKDPDPDGFISKSFEGTEYSYVVYNISEYRKGWKACIFLISKYEQVTQKNP